MAHVSEPQAVCRACSDLPRVSEKIQPWPLTRFRSAMAFSSANTTLLLLLLFLDRRSLTSGRVLPGKIGSSCSTLGALGDANSWSKLNGKRDSSKNCS